VADDTPDQEKLPDHEYGHTEYVVGDYINLELTVYHEMHVLEARVVYTHEDDDALEVIVAGEPELGEEDGSSGMTSTLRASRRITLDDVPGTYALSRVELVTASTRTLTLEYERRPAFEIVPEPDHFNVRIRLEQYTRRPLYPTDEEYD
jgi:hypothetical protein